MSKPKFGVIYSRLHDIVAPRDFAKTVEELAFDSVWATEGLVNQIAALDPILVMGDLIHGSNKLRVGSCVILSPLRNPAVLAKEIATLDFFSDGRVTLGVAVGGSALSNPADYSVSGVDLKHRAGLCNEGIEVMRRLWSGEPVSFKGEYFEFSDIYMQPRPIQTPHPPIWIGGNAGGAVRRAARYGDGFVPVGTGANDYKLMWKRLTEHCDSQQRNPEQIVPAVHLYLCMAETRADARRIAEETLSTRYGFTVDIEDDQRYLLGNPDDCSDVIDQYLEVGVREFVINTVRPLTEVQADIQRFAETVMPRYR